MSYDFGKCPNCKLDFKGDPIPEDVREYYSPPYFWDKKIAVELNHDRIEYYLCPECGYKMYSAFTKIEKKNNKIIRKPA